MDHNPSVSADVSLWRLPQILMVSSLVAVLLSLAGCSGDDTYFQALADDPMAEYQPLGTQLSRRSENAATGFITQGRAAPYLLFEYRVLDGADAESGLEETLHYAVSMGWVFDAGELTPTGNLRIEGTKDLGLPLPGELSFSLSEDKEELFVRLTYPQGTS